MELSVRFLVIKTGAVVDRRFNSYIECKNFVNKLKHSKKLQLLSYPTFY